MSHKIQPALKVHSNKSSKLVNTESEFAAEFGEGLYGAQARISYKEQQQKKSNHTVK